MRAKKDNVDKKILILLMISSILLPPIRLEKIPDVRIDLIVIAIVWGAIILSTTKKNGVLKTKRTQIDKWFFLIGFSIFVSMACAAMFQGCYPGGRDLNEFLKLGKYFLIFMFAINVSLYTIKDLHTVYKTTLMIFLGAAFVGFAQFLNVLDINSVISPYYAPTQMDGLLAHNRITGTTANPNIFGALMLMGVAVSFSGALMLEQTKLKFFSWFCVFIYAIAIVLTLSRSSFICLLVILVFILFYKYPKLKNKSVLKLLAASMLILVIAFVVVEVAPQKFFIRISTLQDISDAMSARTEKWALTINYWMQSPILGWGPGNGIKDFSYYVDNEWLLILRNYGVLGFSVFVGWFVSSYNFLSKGIKNNLNRYCQCFCIALQASLIAYAIYMIPAAVYHSLQLMSVLSLYLGLTASIVLNSHEEHCL